MRLSELKSAQYNPRVITDEALDGLKYSLKEFGDLSGIVFNRATGNLVAGHQRVKALVEEHGDIEIKEVGDSNGAISIIVNGKEQLFAVRFVNWSPEMEIEANIAANSPTIAGAFTNDLAPLLTRVKDKNKTAFEKMQFSKLMGEIEKQEEKENEVKGEIQFSTELDYESNYVVLHFTKDIDWLYVQSLFGITPVHSYRRNGKPWSKGQGRIIGGVEAIARIKKAAKEEKNGESILTTLIP